MMRAVVSLKVMTYNVRYFGHALPFRGATATRKGIARIGQQLAELESRPDVVCLQEVEARSLRSRWSHTPGVANETQLEAFMSVLGKALDARAVAENYRSYYFPAHEYRVGPTRIYTTGLAILVRRGLVVRAHNSDRPIDVTYRKQRATARLKQGRICAHLTVEGDGLAPVHIFNTHLSLPAFAELDVFQSGKRMGYGSNQLREVEALAGAIAEQSPAGRFLVVGDFNALPGSPAYQRFVHAAGVRDGFADHLGISSDELRDAWPTAGFMHLRMRLDHFFVGPRLETIDAEGNHPFGTGPWHGLSDHVPVFCRVR